MSASRAGIWRCSRRRTGGAGLPGRRAGASFRTWNSGWADEPFGTANRCIMLRQGYIELLAVDRSGAAFSDTMDERLARYAGLHIIALAVGRRRRGQFPRLRLAGMDIRVSPVSRAAGGSRRGPGGTEGTFRAGAAARGGAGGPQSSSFATSHRKRSGRSGSFRHPNGAVALEEVVLAVDRAGRKRPHGCPCSPGGR